jgi:hypothetical protein
MHRGHPARTMGAAPPPGAAAAASGLPSDDTHELGGDAVDEDEDDTRRGDVTLPLPLSPPGRAVVVVDGAPPGPPLALDRPSLRNSSFDALPLFLLIVTAAAQVPITGTNGFNDVSVTARKFHATFAMNSEHALP